MGDDIRAVLEEVRQGNISVDDALLAIRKEPFHDIDFAKIDLHRKVRQGAADAGADGNEAGAGAVSVADARPLPHDLVHGLVPADALEPALAALADPLHGPAQSLFGKKGLGIAQALHAGRQRHAAGAVRRRLRREPLDLPVLHMHVDHAFAAAVAEPHGVDDLFLCHKRTSAVIFMQRLYHKGRGNARRGS
ncbi:MAG: hypothetical protein J6Y90_02265, partial [Lachnospiraceae bacterium]|nr:hypothetical protein [Lachnospiraceae bacterium]